MGDAKFTGPKTMEIKTKDGTTPPLTFNQCVIATGSRPMNLKGFDIDQKRIVDSTGALALEEAPKSMLCIGGGYIGLELGTFYAKVGTKVTVMEAFPTLLGSVDPDLVRVVAKRLEKKGVRVMLKTAVNSCKPVKKGVEVSASLAENGKEQDREFRRRDGHDRPRAQHRRPGSRENGHPARR